MENLIQEALKPEKAVSWRHGNGIMNIFLPILHFSPTTSVVRISSPLLLLWHSTSVHSWEHRHPPLWEQTCRVCSGNLHTPIPQWCSVSVVVHCSSHSEITCCQHILSQHIIQLSMNQREYCIVSEDVGIPLSFEQCTQMITSQPVICENHAEDCWVDSKNGCVQCTSSRSAQS